jgi:hypothetical protein
MKSISARTSLTFDEWVENGYRIKKGEKSKGRDAKGRPTFTLKQVWFVPENKRDIYLAPPKPAEPPKEIIAEIKRKKIAEEERHNYIDPTFDPTDQIFSPEDEPPW